MPVADRKGGAMNVGIIPVIMSAAVSIVCAVAAFVGGLLLINMNSRRTGVQVLRCSGLALITGVFFAWAAMLPCGLVWHFSDRLAILVLWASGPVGALFGVAWHCLRLPITRNRSSQPNDSRESE